VETQFTEKSSPPTMMSGDLFTRTAQIAVEWLRSLDRRPVAESATVDQLRSRLGGSLPVSPVDPLLVVEELARAAEPGLVAIPSGRYFGFVIGGGLPAAVAADWLTSVWDQCPGSLAYVRSSTPGPRRRSCVPRPVRSTPAPSTTSTLLPTLRPRRARGCTSTVPLAYRPPPARSFAISSPVSTAPTPGPLMPTSGSTSRTTPA
jgi:hypothetical protein